MESKLPAAVLVIIGVLQGAYVFTAFPAAAASVMVIFNVLLLVFLYFLITKTRNKRS
ncbi:hypothetical protein V1498_10775 [Peribacillus sp. SCS-26]|uniref:hypothetical protein n=1 Tax=Paraperibacillus marinus TaxID=3115295 RepID=UPI003905A318